MKKTIISFITSVVVLSMLVMTPAKALENSIAFASQDDQILVTLNVKDTNIEALTMKASFQIKAQNGDIKKEDVQFHFDQSIKSVVKEYRYDSGLLTIYISGQDNLFANKQVKLGTIDLKISKDTKIDISLVKDSLEYVSSTYSKDILQSQEASIEWGDTLEKPSTPESKPSDDQENDKETSQDHQKPSVDITDDSKDNTIQDTGVDSVQNPSSQTQTGDTTNILVYACMAVASLIVVLYVTKRKISKRH